VIYDAAVSSLLVSHWGLTGAIIDPHHGGMNSATWWVDYDRQRYVVKHTPGWNRDDLVGGLSVAAMVQRGGIPSGAPVPTVDGDVVAETPDGPIALLTFVPGAEPPLDEAGLAVIGRTLGRVHLVLANQRIDLARDLHRPNPDASHNRDGEPWVSPGIRRALAEYDALVPNSLTHGLLHTDPAPEAFLVDPDVAGPAAVGLIDWAAACYGPLLFDLASAVMYVGGPERAGPLLDAYLATGALDRSEVDRGLDALRRLRWAVQASYFSHRIATSDMTGIDDHAENLIGLADARPHLTE